MAKMRKGTHVGVDKNLKNICVGDRIKDAEGNIYTIDSYGKAITPDDKKGFKSFDLSRLKDIEFFAREMVDPGNDPGPCVELERARIIICDNLKGTDPGTTVLAPGGWENNERQMEPKILDAIPDRVLVLELRRRGWDVTATKTVSL